MIDWIDTQVGLPRDGDLCLVYAKSRGAVLGPIAFRASRSGSGAWVDRSLLNSRIGPGEVSHWCAFTPPDNDNRRTSPQAMRRQAAPSVGTASR